MNVSDVKARVDKLASDVAASEGGDEETWHGEQDDILTEALQAIADGAEQPAELAREALRVCDIEFARWYA